MKNYPILNKFEDRVNDMAERQGFDKVFFRNSLLFNRLQLKR